MGALVKLPLPRSMVWVSTAALPMVRLPFGFTGPSYKPTVLRTWIGVLYVTPPEFRCQILEMNVLNEPAPLIVAGAPPSQTRFPAPMEKLTVPALLRLPPKYIRLPVAPENAFRMPVAFTVASPRIWSRSVVKVVLYCSVPSTVRFWQRIARLFALTTWPAAMTTCELASGTTPPTQVVPAFQLPVAAEVIVAGVNSSTDRLSMKRFIVPQVLVISNPILAFATRYAAGMSTLIRRQADPVPAPLPDIAMMDFQVAPLSFEAITRKFALDAVDG